MCMWVYVYNMHVSVIVYYVCARMHVDMYVRLYDQL